MKSRFVVHHIAPLDEGGTEEWDEDCADRFTAERVAASCRKYGAVSELADDLSVRHENRNPEGDTDE